VADTVVELRSLLTEVGLDPGPADLVEEAGPSVALPSVLDVTTVATTAVAASTLSAGLWAARRAATQPEPVTVDRRHAALSFRAERSLRVGDADPPALWDPLAGYYRDREGGWLQLHTNFEHHRAAVLEVLGVEASRDAVAAAIVERRADDLEVAIARAGGCAARMRTRAEWEVDPAARAVADTPLVDLRPVGPPGSTPPPATPGRLRVLDLTRVVAGPVAGMVLADHGADVLHVLGPHLPTIDALHVGTGFAKREAHLDLHAAADHERFAALVAGADVLLDAFRPGALAALGFDLGTLCALRPGLVVVQLSAYGQAGPRARWRGFDSLVQTTSGICDEGRRAAGREEPTPLPAQVLDYATGHLAAFAALAGVLRRQEEGGSWCARLALARTALWLQGLPRVPAHAPAGDEDPSDLLEQTESPFGTLTAIRPVGGIGGRPVTHRGPPHRRGADEAVWAQI